MQTKAFRNEIELDQKMGWLMLEDFHASCQCAWVCRIES